MPQLAWSIQKYRNKVEAIFGGVWKINMAAKNVLELHEIVKIIFPLGGGVSLFLIHANDDENSDVSTMTQS